jgi:hypothetical protein
MGNQNNPRSSGLPREAQPSPYILYPGTKEGTWVRSSIPGRNVLAAEASNRLLSDMALYDGDPDENA